MKKLLAIMVCAALAGCGKEAPTAQVEAPTAQVDRPLPPHFLADGNAPSAAVAVDFIKNYSDVVRAAVERTPYDIKDANEQMRAAQELYKTDSTYLTAWMNAGVSLFRAARSNTCETFVKGEFATWEQAYPLNGPPIKAEMDKKLEYAARTDQLREFCMHATTLTAWGT
ncbi:hypothetical protein [Burkholderia glumae]|uniref:hypothetical protein n=1 Tax=Burkholderia glumae TaxID=337 RepID=UPI00215006F0|nr:hypothetical protein [Burkholderia glumae]